MHARAVDLRDLCLRAANDAAAHRLFEQPCGNGGRVDHGVVVDDHAAHQSLAQAGLRFAQLLRVQHRAGDALALQRLLACLRERLLLLVGGDPERAATHERMARIEARRKLVPQHARPRAQCEFLGRVVHHDEMAHARGRYARTHARALDHEHVEALRGEFVGARRAHDARADHDDIGVSARALDHVRMPQANGSSSAKISLDSALICALPRMLGRTYPAGRSGVAS